MINIAIADTTLREAESEHSARMSFKEKLETAKLLEKLQVDVIETGHIGQSPAGAVFIRTLASTLENSIVCLPVSLDKQEIDRAWDALAKAKKPRLNILAPTSTVQMEYKNNVKAEAMIPLIAEITAHCLDLCFDVEFTAVDATRSEPVFLAKALKTAIAAGAKTVTLCDSVGELLPEELASFISSVYESVPELHDVRLSLQCKDALGLASAVALSGIKSGVRQIKVSSGTNTETLSLVQFLNVIKTRGETLGMSYNVNDTAFRRTSAQLAALTGGGGGGSGGSGAGGGTGAGGGIRLKDGLQDENPEPDLPENADIGTLKSHISALGYEITDDDLERVFTQYKEISRSKKVVGRDIDALVAETAGQATQTYQLRSFVINSGSSITATAHLELSRDNTVLSALSAGDGPIDAAFKAAGQIVGAHYELEEFQIQAVTGGREATGDALVKLRHGGKLYSGRGVSTDIIGASIRAYLSAVNKIVFDERQS